MDLSLIIVNWNVRDLLEKCLDSIYSNLKDLTFEVIVVDNASRDSSVEMIRERFPQATLIANDQNAGFCGGNNQGLAVAKGDYLLLLNPDTEVYEGSLETLIRFMRDQLDVGVTGPTLLAPDGLYFPNGTRFPTVRYELLGLTGLSRFRQNAQKLEGYGRDDFSKLAEVDVVCGACLMMRREVYEQIGGLDEQFFMYYDEVDFCLRARRAGWRCFYVPESRVYHHWMGSVRQDSARSTRRLYHSQFLYHRKHHGLPAALLLRSISAVVVALRTARIKGGAVKRRLLRRSEKGAAA